MSKTLYWAFSVLVIVIVGFVALQVYLHIDNKNFEEELEATRMNPDPPSTPEQVNGHSHEDGTFHAAEPPDPIPQDDTPQIGPPDEPKVQYTAPKGAVLKPKFPEVDPKADPVKEAYKRLEYIKNNPYAWGGVHSERATELIDELMPPSVPIDHAHGDAVIELIEELCEQGDPRGAEALIAIICEGGTLGPSMTDALEEIGPPAVPYILPYVREKYTMTAVAIEVLGRISYRYRDDLGGIVDHIIIPKLKVIADDENNERYESPCPSWAREALDLLQ